MSNYTNMMREMAEKATQERQMSQQETEESMLSLMTHQLGGGAVAESMAREVLNEAPWEEGS